jgi:hypothetical protein
MSSHHRAWQRHFPLEPCPIFDTAGQDQFERLAFRDLPCARWHAIHLAEDCADAHRIFRRVYPRGAFVMPEVGLLHNTTLTRDEWRQSLEAQYRQVREYYTKRGKKNFLESGL